VDHKVRIIGDSHIRDTAARINQYLNTKFEVCSLIKLCANTKQLVDSLNNDFECLGKKNVIVLNGGANDIDTHSNNMKGALVQMTQFMQKYNNTNIIEANIPHRHEPDKAAMAILDIQAFNRKLNKITKSLRHVALVEIDPNRKCFTRHVMHLNKDGKEWLSKQIATQISKSVTNIRHELVIVLNWNDGPTDEQITADIHSKLEVSLNQNNNSQGTAIEEEVIVSRTSNRDKKAPVTRNNYFLW
jgi:23S rRNA pseudoU1915 N3-methylase RlmH